MTVIQAPPARARLSPGTSAVAGQCLGRTGSVSVLTASLHGARSWASSAGLLPPCSAGGAEGQPDPRPSGVAGTGKNARQTVRGPGSGF